jgi:opacity protein-like surface antigen
MTTGATGRPIVFSPARKLRRKCISNGLHSPNVNDDARKENRMTSLRISVIAALATMLLAIPQPVRAQDNTGEFSAGWRLLHFEEQTFGLGWYADVLANLTDTLGVVGEVSGQYKTSEETRMVAANLVSVSTDLRIHSFMGGIRFSARQNPRIVPFGQALFGLVHGSASIEGSTTVGGRTFTVNESESDNDAAFELGGGVNVAITNNLTLRFAASYFRVIEDDASNSVALAVGAVFPF